MSDANESLDAVRREIDEIDTALHDLLMRRAEIVSRVAQAKGRSNAAIYAPAREAIVMRKRLAQNKGPLPAQVVVRIWREIITAAAAMQGAYRITAYVSAHNQRCWDLARDHFGSFAEMTPVDDATAVVHSVSAGEAAIGIVPAPQKEETDPWWLAMRDGEFPCVACVLPFAGSSNARAGAADAFAIANIVPVPTGTDKTLLCFAGIDAKEVSEQLSAQKLSGTVISSTNNQEHLVEVDIFLDAEDNRLAAMNADFIGAFAAPETELKGTME